MRLKLFNTIGKVVAVAGMAMAVTVGLSGNTLQAEAATKAQLAEFREELKTMILTADSSVHNVAKYNMTYQESSSVWRDLEQSDCKIACYNGRIYGKTSRNSNNILQTYQVAELDDDFLNRYQLLCENVDKALAGIDEDMSDLDKVLYFHEYLLDNVYFKNENDISHKAGGPLGYGYGVCQGYGDAMELLLSEVGIQSVYMISVDMNHVWVYINLDGEWYHTDVLWDDSSSDINNKNCKHVYLLRNDKEFENINGHRHYNWFSAYCKEPSTSTRFSNWFVHDVKGIMRYYEGFWYFQKDNSIMKAKIDGTQMSEVLKTTDTVTLNTIEDGMLYYTSAGVTKTYDLQGRENTPVLLEGDWNINDIDWTDANYWQLGHYKPSDGSYGYYKGRICLKEKVAVNAEKYTINIAEDNYHVLIREFDSEGVMINSYNLANGKEYVPDSEAVSFGVSVYNTKDDRITYKEYQELLKKGTIIIQAEKTVETADPDNLIGDMDISRWQEGHYSYVDGTHTSFKGRICLKEFVPVEQKTYKITVSDKAFHVLLRELDSNKKFICSDDLVDGDVFTPKDNTAYLAISLYNENTREITFEQYGGLMKNGLKAEIKPYEKESLENMDINQWQAGHYDYADGSYKPFRGRICCKDLTEVKGGETVKAAISESGYRLLIRELDKDKKFLGSLNLVDGDTAVLKKNTAYLAVSIYNEQNADMTYEQYGDLFAEGFTAILTVK